MTHVSFSLTHAQNVLILLSKSILSEASDQSSEIKGLFFMKPQAGSSLGRTLLTL